MGRSFSLVGQCPTPTCKIPFPPSAAPSSSESHDVEYMSALEMLKYALLGSPGLCGCCFPGRFPARPSFEVSKRACTFDLPRTLGLPVSRSCRSQRKAVTIGRNDLQMAEGSESETLFTLNASCRSWPRVLLTYLSIPS